jgi:hypothetical protein
MAAVKKFTAIISGHQRPRESLIAACPGDDFLKTQHPAPARQQPRANKTPI